MVSRENFFHFALIASAVTIPLPNSINSISLIVLVLAGIVYTPWAEFKRNLTGSYLWILPTIYFLWLAMTWFWDITGGFSFQNLERYAVFLFIPPLLAGSRQVSPANIKRLCYAFAGVTIILCVLSLVLSWIEYRELGDYRVFYYHYLSQQVGLNAIFLSNYALAGMTFLFYYNFFNGADSSPVSRVIAIVGIVFLSLMVLLLSSKMSILLLLILLLSFIVYIAAARRKRVMALGIVVVLALGISVAFSNLSYMQWRFKATELKDYKGSIDDNNGLAVRFVMWQTALELIGDRPLTGYGLRGAKEATMEKYEQKGFEIGIREQYNSHNQYFETALMSGIPGLLILLLMILWFFWKGLQRRDVLLLFFTLLFIIKSLVEATLEIQQELIFFVFFLFFFYYRNPQPATRNLQPET